MTEKLEIKDVYVYALGYCILKDSTSIAMIQRLMKIHYALASMAVDWMEQNGYVTPFTGKAPRKVLLSLEQYKEKFNDILNKKKLIYKKYEKDLQSLIN